MKKEPSLCVSFSFGYFSYSIKNLYDIFPKNYNFLEKYMSLCYTTSRLINGENT